MQLNRNKLVKKAAFKNERAKRLRTTGIWSTSLHLIGRLLYYTLNGVFK